MRVKQIDHGLELGKPADGYIRSPGMHMSTLYGELFKQLDPSRFDRRDKAGNPEPMDMAKIELGLTFEELLEVALVESIVGERPGEFVTPHEDDCPNAAVEPNQEAACACGAGVAYSPDFLIYEQDRMVLGEFKCTWMSSRGAPTDPKFDKWMVQIKAYCYHLQTTYARLYVFFVCGDYKPPSPKLLAWDIVFTQRELQDNWNVLLRVGRKKGLLAA